jgi:pimeloyl-ACP methyl ester carboxylesterase
MTTLATVTPEGHEADRKGTRRSSRVLSKDGTAIAYERIGAGPLLILVDGALCSRAFGPMKGMAAELMSRFTVLTYDRRGRGESGPGAEPYSVDREVEDLEALIAEGGGTACLFGISSGAALALAAAARGLGIQRLAVFEPPFVVEPGGPALDAAWTAIDAALAAGDTGAAAKAFLKAVGVPGVVLGVMRWLPLWAKILASAPTLPHDGAFVREFQRGAPLPAERWASVTIPVLTLDGGKSPRWIRTGTRALAAALRNAEHRTLEGQTHAVKPKAVAPVLAEFFAASG